MSRIYDSRQWKAARAQQLRKFPLCEECMRRGRMVPAKHVDHVKAINDGGEAFDAANLASLCVSCHSIKTRHIDHYKQGRVPMKGVDAATGMPLDDQHWWRKRT